MPAASSSMRQRNLCGSSGHCLLRESQGVSQSVAPTLSPIALFFMQASFLPSSSPFLEAHFLCCSSQWPLTERTETDTPPSQRFVWQYGQLWSGTKAHRRCPHTVIPPPLTTTTKKKKKTCLQQLPRPPTTTTTTTSCPVSPVYLLSHSSASLLAATFSVPQTY